MYPFKTKFPHQFELTAFGAQKTPTKLYFQAERQEACLKFEYILVGVDRVKLPELTPKPQLRDLLWEHTCFELFLNSGGTRYVEINLSPSGDWNIFAFDSYRTPAKHFTFKSQVPYFNCILDPDKNLLNVRGEIDLGQCNEFLGKTSTKEAILIGATVVVEGKNGTKDYWALNHPKKQKADFHEAAGFSAKIT